jgi:hypothetical protein
MKEKEMTQEVIIETIILSPFPQMINGEEYTAFIVLAKTKNEDGSVNPRYEEIGQIGPDTTGQVSWVDDGSITIYDDFNSLEVTSLSDYVAELLERYWMEGGGGFETPPNVGEG